MIRKCTINSQRCQAEGDMRKFRHKKTSRKRLVLLGFLVGTRGFEPPTPDTP